jgi:hypothetical protein
MTHMSKHMCSYTCKKNLEVVVPLETGKTSIHWCTHSSANGSQYSYFFLNFGSTRVELRASHLFQPLSYPFLHWLFFRYGLTLCQAGPDHNPPICASLCSWDDSHTFSLDEVLWTFPWGWPWTAFLPILTFWVARITGLNHHTWLDSFFVAEQYSTG